MSEQPISRSADLQRLLKEGYEVEVRESYLVVGHVPYVDSERQVRYGTLVSTLVLAGDVTARPDTHVTTFAGEAPCDREGEVLTRIMAGSERQQLADGLVVDHMFSSKPADGYANYYDKMTGYIRIISAPARALDPNATAQTFRVIEETDDTSVFEYLDTASSRSGIGAITAKLRIGKVAIVGLGGTGSFVFDLVAKTPVEQIHLFDGDLFLQHNAFRSPGASSIEELQGAPSKVAYLQERYAKMRRGIVAHDEYVDASNVEELREMDFVFLTLDDGEARKLIVEKLEEWGTSFIDVGLGVYEADGYLGGLVRTTTSTPLQRRHVWDKQRIPFGPADPDNEYRQNIQVADLNALNASLAVIKWKKLAGFYLDLEAEHFSVYQLDGNSIINEDKSR